MIEKNPYNTSTDIFSLGVIIWEILVRKFPYEDFIYKTKDSDTELKNAIVKGLRPTFPETNFPVDYKFIIENCWTQQDSRFNALQVLTHLQKILQRIQKN